MLHIALERIFELTVLVGIVSAIGLTASGVAAAGFWSWWLASDASSLRARRWANRATVAVVWFLGATATAAIAAPALSRMIH